MRWFDRFRARMLTAGVGMILAGTMTGCWDAPKRPNNFTGLNSRGNTNNGTAGQPGATGWQGNASASGGSPINRQTGGGMPLFDRDGQPVPRGAGPLGGAPTSKASAPSNPSLLTPPAGANDQQPIATSGAKPGSGIQPVNYGKSETAGGMPDPLKLPLPDGAAASGPAVTAPPPISTERLDTKPKFRSSPEIPTDSLSMPSAPPPPSKSGVLLMPPTP